jgi:hypothetical protein
MADNLAELIAERERRAGRVTGGTRSVLEEPKETTTLDEVKKAVTSLLKGSTKGVIDIVGGWGNLYDVIKENKDPNPLSSRGLVNAINKAGGPDLMKIEGYRGLYDIGQAGAPAAAMTAMAPGSSLFRMSTPLRTAGTEFTAAGTLGLLSQQVAPESMAAQVTMQTLPYLVKGGVSGYRAKAQQDKIKEYVDLLPKGDKNIFEEFMLRGQGSSDPVIAADIARLSRSPKYLELVTALNEGAAKQAVMGIEPKAAPLTQEQAKVAIIQGIQNKLEGIRDSKSDKLFEKAKEYGGGQGIVDPTVTIANIDNLIGRYSAQTTPNAARAVEVLQGIRERLQPTQSAVFGAQPSSSFTVREGTQGFSVPSQPGGVRIVERQVPTFDALGTPTGMKTVREEVPFSGEPSKTFAGTPATIGTRPSSSGTAVRYQNTPEKLTVEQTQGILSEFGKRASAGDNLIKDLSISDERVISSAIFGGLKEDVRNAIKTSTGADKSALNLLSEARSRVEKSSNAYREAIAQGMPAYLQNKTLAEVSPEELLATYKSLTPTQRASMRSWVENTDSAALSVLDKQIFDEFVNKAKAPNATGVETVNLELMAKNWRGLNAVDRDALATALGTNATEFGNRMKDAELMTRKMSVSPATEQPIIGGQTVREASAVMGATGGYSTSKIGQLAFDVVNNFSKGGLNEDQLMKALLTPEGAKFLKTAALSPRSENVLKELTQMEQSNPVARWMVGTTARLGPRMASAEQPTVQTEQEAIAGQDELAALLEEQRLRQSQQPVAEENGLSRLLQERASQMQQNQPEMVQ